MTNTTYLSIKELRSFVATRDLVILTGHGSAGGIADLEKAKRDLDREIRRVLQDYEKITFVFGGDPNDESKPDIGALVAYVASKGHEVLAIQSDTIKKWGGFENLGWASLEWAHLYQEDLHGNGKTCWGGFIADEEGCPTEKLGGTTRILFGPGIHSRIVKWITVGGGPITLQEIQFAQEFGIPVTYVPCRKRNSLEAPEDETPVEKSIRLFGEVHPYVLGLHNSNI